MKDFEKLIGKIRRVVASLTLLALDLGTLVGAIKLLIDLFL